MSVNNAPGEVDNKDIFDSPNISGAEEETAEAVDKAAEEQKKRETVDIDGVPIDEKDIKYKAEDIRKKKKMKYFVNVEGEKEREKAEAKKQAEVKRVVEKMNAEAEHEVEREEKAAKAAEAKKQAEEEKQIKEVEAFVKKQKKEAAREEKRSRSDDLSSLLKKIFIDGWHKFATAGVLVAIIIVVVCAIVIPKTIKPDDSGEEGGEAGSSNEVASDEYSEAIKKINSKSVTDALDNYRYDEFEEIYTHLADGVSDNKYKALLYLDGANKILASDKNEAARAERMVDKAYACGSNDVTVMESVVNMYTLLESNQKRAAAEEKLNKLYSEIKYDDNLTEEDWYGEG